MANCLPAGGLWLDVSGNADTLDAHGDRARLGLLRLSLSDLASAVEPHFEVLSVRRAMYGGTPGRTRLSGVGQCVAGAARTSLPLSTTWPGALDHRQPCSSCRSARTQRTRGSSMRGRSPRVDARENATPSRHRTTAGTERASCRRGSDGRMAPLRSGGCRAQERFPAGKGADRGFEATSPGGQASWLAGGSYQDGADSRRGALFAERVLHTDVPLHCAQDPRPDWRTGHVD